MVIGSLPPVCSYWCGMRLVALASGNHPCVHCTSFSLRKLRITLDSEDILIGFETSDAHASPMHVATLAFAQSVPGPRDAI